MQSRKKSDKLTTFIKTMLGHAGCPQHLGSKNFITPKSIIVHAATQKSLGYANSAVKTTGLWGTQC